MKTIKEREHQQILEMFKNNVSIRIPAIKIVCPKFLLLGTYKFHVSHITKLHMIKVCPRGAPYMSYNDPTHSQK
uniref:Uncharacterized protein n=1 Tax=viral metagenome TaxID=1070528 RepID=A0A6C0LTP6_9ZZZZ